MTGKVSRWLALFIVGILAGKTPADDPSIDQVPRPALAAVMTTTPGAKLLSARKLFEDHKTVYEVRCKQYRHVLKVVVTHDGKILRRIRILEPRLVPSLIRKTAEERHPGFLIDSAEQESAVETVTYHVVLVARGGKKWEMKIDPHGRILEDQRMDSETATPAPDASDRRDSSR